MEPLIAARRLVRCPYCRGRKMIPAYDASDREPDPLRKRYPAPAPLVPCPYCEGTGELIVEGVETPDAVQAAIKEVERSWH